MIEAVIFACKIHSTDVTENCRNFKEIISVEDDVKVTNQQCMNYITISMLPQWSEFHIKWKPLRWSCNIYNSENVRDQNI